MTVSGLGTANTYPSSLASASSQPATVASAVAEGTANSPASSIPAAQPSVEVMLGSTPSEDTSYAKLVQASTFKTAWATPATDDISRQMQNNLKDHSKSGQLSSLFNGLGSQLLNTFSTSQGDFHQTVAVYRPQYSISADAGTTEVNANALQAAKAVQNSIGLKIYTASGKTVDIAITFGGDGNSIKDSLSIDLHTSASLTIAEQVAIAKLANGFDAALQGVAQDSTKVDVAGLIDFDTSVLSSVDLKVRGGPPSNALQSLDLHADTRRRSFALQSQTGKVSVNVDLSTAAALGADTQQQTTIQGFLDQFDAAGRRGHGDATLTEQLKDAFAQLHSSYPASSQQHSRALSASQLSTADQLVLSGLADFQASMSGDFSNGPPLGYTTEAGHLDYQVSQTTKLHGTDKNSGLAVEQTQAASLNSNFARSRGGALDKDSGNYDSYQINDNSSITTSIEYFNNRLKNASVTNMVNQSEKYQKLVGGKVVAESNTPQSSFTVDDISATLQP